MRTLPLTVFVLLCQCGVASNDDTRWIPPEQEEPDSLAAARDQNSTIIAAARDLLLENEVLVVDENSYSQFPDHEIMEGFTSRCPVVIPHYSLEKRDGQLRLTLSEHFVEAWASEDARRIVDQVSACLPDLQDVWTRYGVVLQVNITTSWQTPVPPPNANVVTLTHDVDARGNSRLFTPAFDCTTILHEFGHHLGLQDEYAEEGTCRESNAEEMWPWSMMGSRPPGSSLERFDFLARHLRKIVEPIYLHVLPKCISIKPLVALDEEHGFLWSNDRVTEVTASNRPNDDDDWSPPMAMYWSVWTKKRETLSAESILLKQLVPGTQWLLRWQSSKPGKTTYTGSFGTLELKTYAPSQTQIDALAANASSALEISTCPN